MAERIKARAIRQGGLLLAQVKGARGKRTDKPGGQASPKLSRKEAAKAARLSRDQAREMLQVANVAEPQFETLVEAPRPASIKQIKASRSGGHPCGLVGGHCPRPNQRIPGAPWSSCLPVIGSRGRSGGRAELSLCQGKLLAIKPYTSRISLV
jgi:hypothetical protein